MSNSAQDLNPAKNPTATPHPSIPTPGLAPALGLSQPLTPQPPMTQQPCQCRTIAGKNGFVNGEICDCAQPPARTDSTSPSRPSRQLRYDSAPQRTRFDGELAELSRALGHIRADSRPELRPGLTPDQRRRCGNYRHDAAAPSCAPVPQPQAQLSSAARRMGNYRRPLSATKNPPQ